MKTALEIMSWVAVVTGGLAIVGSEGDIYAFVGGLLFLTEGVLALSYVKKTK